VLGTAGLDDPAVRYLMILLHAGGDAQEFVAPQAVRRLPWRLFIDTAAEPPGDIYPDATGPAFPPRGPGKLGHHSPPSPGPPASLPPPWFPSSAWASSTMRRPPRRCGG
ncbi:MAG TPA: hypothetical protein PKC18_18885, partial [Lacipirellulaceae bacterium]|nr:hypothetical protein [Lacipirellulaceae bacterium]